MHVLTQDTMRRMVARTLIYARQSRDLTGEGLAVERQIEQCVKLAESRDLGDLLPPIVDNDVSASSGKSRVGYGKMVELIEAGAVDTIVAYHLDRLLRSMVDLEQLIVLCEQHHVRIMTVAGDLDLSTDMGRLVGRILASVARGEVERKGRRQKDAAVQAAKAGRAPSRGAFGHQRFRREGSKRIAVPLEQVEAEAAAVRECYEKLFAGHTPGAMAENLNARGFTTTRGNPWTRTEVRAMLLNPRNAGLRYLSGERIGQGDWPEIVSEETWQAAVGLLSDPSRRTSPGSARKWLGSGLYLCGLCNESAMKTARRDKGVRGYRCNKYLHNNRGADKIDEYVLRTVAGRLRKIDVVRHFAGADRSAEVAALRVEAGTLRQKLHDIGVDYADGVLTKDQVRIANQRCESRLAEIDKVLGEIGRRSELAELIEADDPGQAFLDATLQVQRVAVAALCTVVLLPNRENRRWSRLADTVSIDFHDEE